MNTDIVDLIRVLMVVVPGMAVIGVTLAVVISYGKAYRVDRKMAKITGYPLAGLLTSHVTLIGTSYLILVGVAVGDTIARMGEGQLGIRSPVRSTALIIGFIALTKILRFERKRYHNTIEQGRKVHE